MKTEYGQHLVNISVRVGDAARDIDVIDEPARAAHTAKQLSAAIAGSIVMVQAAARVWLQYEAGVLLRKRSWEEFYTLPEDEEGREQKHAVDLLVQNAR